MFYIYTMHPDGDRVRYSMRQPIALFGAKIQGLIPRRLQASIGSGRNTPPAWRLSVAEELSQEGRHDAAVVIDIKPSSKREVKLVHLLDVWGTVTMAGHLSCCGQES